MKERLRRVRYFIIKLILIALPSAWINLVLHEGGHALVGIITGNEVNYINLGITNPHVSLNINNEEAIPYIAIGAFVLPLIVSIIILFIDNDILNIFNIINIVSTVFNIIINVMAILSMSVPAATYKYDFERFVESSHVSDTIVSIISMAIVLILCIYLVYLMKKVLYKEIIQ